MKDLIMQNSQMKEGQSDHDDHYGYGLLRVDLLLDAMGNSSASTLDVANLIRPAVEENVSETIQVRRSTARVPPVSSTNPRE